MTENSKLSTKEIRTQIALGLDMFIPLNEELSDNEIKYLLKYDIHFAIYDYEYSSYEGSGNMIYFCKGKWNFHSMSHCSCYGPTENLVVYSGDGYDTLSELVAMCSNEVKESISKMVERIIEND